MSYSQADNDRFTQYDSIFEDYQSKTINRKDFPVKYYYKFAKDTCLKEFSAKFESDEIFTSLNSCEGLTWRGENVKLLDISKDSSHHILHLLITGPHAFTDSMQVRYDFKNGQNGKLPVSHDIAGYAFDEIGETMVIETDFYKNGKKVISTKKEIKTAANNK